MTPAIRALTLAKMERQMRLLPMPASDTAVTIDAIHALIATLPPVPTSPPADPMRGAKA